MKLVNYILFFALLVFLATSISAHAHGGGGMEHETCFIEVGDYQMGFVGYQPKQHPKDKFCDSFPSLGIAVLAFDFFQSKIRELKTGVRIVKVKSPLPVHKFFPDDNGETIVVKEPAVNSNGLLIINHEFAEPGNFVALVSIEGSDGRQHIGRFPFSVGTPIENLVLYLGGAIVMLAIGYVAAKFMFFRKSATAV